MSETLALARELDRTRAERDGYRDALEATTHDFMPRRPGQYGCLSCHCGRNVAIHQTPDVVLAALGLEPPGAES